jgi:PPOX class probable F420-dependent enzyme
MIGLYLHQKGENMSNLETYQDLLADEKKAFAFLGTVMPDGSPQVTPIWFNTDGKHILINSAEGRVKDRNMRARPQVALAIMDPEDPYRYVQFRGEVVDIVYEGAEDHISALAYKYRGVEKFKKNNPQEVRVIYKILPDKVDIKE